MKKIWNILFSRKIDFKVRIFNMLALTGILVTLVVFVASVLHGTTFLNCATLLFTAVLATALLVYSVKTHRYMQCYIMTIVFVFILLFPVMFFTAGGYHSGMPCFFVFAIVFTVFMLEGKIGIIFTALEIILYCACCLVAYFYPQLVSAYPDERGVLTDVIISFAVSGIALAAALFCMIRLYNNQQRMLEDATKAAESSNEAKSRFLSQMSHEIRTPINAVLGMNEMILRGGTAEEIEEYALNIKSAGNTLLSLINDILDFSKIESEKLEINPVEYDLSSMLNDLLHMISDRALKKNLELNVNVSNDIPYRLYGDSVRLKQVITNLMTNAIKYTEHGSITLSVNSTRCDEGAVLLHVSVKDTGIGIKEEDKKLLMQPFQRVDITKNYNIEGSGLGLSITANLLKLMGSSLQMESEYGAGSEFSFDIRQGIVEDVPIGNFENRIRTSRDKTDVYQESFTAPGGRILVVDDNQMNLSVVKGLLKNTGLVVDTALSGAEAIERVRREFYHIIFMDYMMPEMDGVEALEKIRSMPDNKCTDSKIIVLTANAVSGAREMFLENGFDGFLSKPINPHKLEESIVKYLPEEMIISKEREVQPCVNVLDELCKRLPQMDFEKGLANCNGDKDLYLEMLRDFTKLPIKEELDECLKDGDFKNYCIRIHGFKNNAYTIGAIILGDMAYEMERISREELPKEIKILQKHLLEQYERICQQYLSIGQ